MGEFEEFCAQRLRMARAEANMSQEDVAAKAGISPHTLLNMESGQKPINAARLRQVAAVYDKRVEWFTDPGPASDEIQSRSLRSRFRDLPPEAYQEIVDFIRYVIDKYAGEIERKS